MPILSTLFCKQGGRSLCRQNSFNFQYIDLLFPEQKSIRHERHYTIKCIANTKQQGNTCKRRSPHVRCISLFIIYYTIKPYPKFPKFYAISIGSTTVLWVRSLIFLSGIQHYTFQQVFSIRFCLFPPLLPY